MYICFLIYLIGIFLNFENYPHKEASREAPQGCCPAQVVLAQTRSEEIVRDTTIFYPSDSQRASFQRSFFALQTSSSHDGLIECTVALCLVQKAQQECCHSLWVMPHQLESMHRHQLRARGQAGTKPQKEDQRSEMGRRSMDNMVHIYTKSNKEIGDTSKGHTIAETQRQATEGKEEQTDQLRSTGIRSTLARSRCWSTAAATSIRSHVCGGAAFGRAATSLGLFGEHPFGRCAEGDREDQTAASHSQIGQASLPCFGAEAQAISTSADCTVQPPSLMEHLLGRISSALENIRRRFLQEGSESRKACSRSQRGYVRSEREARHGEGSSGQEGRGVLGGPGNIRRHGGGSAGQACQCRRDPGRHQHHVIDFGKWQSAASRRDRGESHQESKERRWKSVWLCGYAAFWCARQVDPQVEACLGLEPESHFAVLQWTHSILDEKDFLNEWKASTQALDLQYEVAPMCGSHIYSSTQRQRTAKHTHRVSFGEIAELYVGCESDYLFQRWFLALEQPISQSKIFCPCEQQPFDAVSLLAAPLRRVDRPLAEPAEEADLIMNIAGIAQDPDEEPESSSESEEASSQEAGEQPSDRHATLLFALHFQEVPLRLDWTDHELFHHHVAQALAIPDAHLYDTHHVRHQPHDLERANVEAIIAHRHGDISPGSSLRLTLVDVEFHSAMPLQQPEIVRKVYKLPQHLGRKALLHTLGLGPYCREDRDHTTQCILWKNHEMISGSKFILMAIQDGDFLRIAVPPAQEQYCHFGTRCVASALQQGISMSELQDRHALSQLGWTDYVLGGPIVPLDPDFETTEELSMLQLQEAPNLDPRPAFLDDESNCGHSACKIYQEVEPPTFTAHAEDILLDHHHGRELPQQHEVIRQLHRHWTDHGVATGLNEDIVITIHTWFLSFPRFMKCTASRTVQLRQDHWHWYDQIRQIWQDLLEPGSPFELYLIHPTPPSSRFIDAGPRHVMVLQRSSIEHSATVLTVLNYQAIAGHTMEQVAVFSPAHPTKQDLIDFFALASHCGSGIDPRCTFWYGDSELDEHGRWHLRHGSSFLLVLHETQPQASDIWNVDDDEVSSMMQQATTAPTLNPQAPAFHPGCPMIHLYHEELQDIYTIWNQHATTWQGESRSTLFRTWFVDHGRQILYCEHPRDVRLYDRIDQWEEVLRTAWKEMVHPGEPLEILLVQPPPPEMQHEYAGHIFLIQNPHDVLITSLFTVFQHGEGLGGPALQLAGTTHEHLRHETIVDGFNRFAQCYTEPITQVCEVWYGNYEIKRGVPFAGRSAMGITVHFRDIRPQAPVLLQLSVSLTKHERLTHGAVAHAHGPCTDSQISVQRFANDKEKKYATELISKDQDLILPHFIELDTPPTSHSVQLELQTWGYDVLAWDCHPHNRFFCCKSPNPDKQNRNIITFSATKTSVIKMVALFIVSLSS